MRRRELLVLLLTSAAVACDRSNGVSVPWSPDRLVAPTDLAARLAEPADRRPRVVHVGPETLFAHGHVPSAVHGGETRDSEGLEAFARLVEPWPRERELVLYCGCCPWKNCPNIRPAYSRAVALGFLDVRVLDLPTTFKADWADKGLPVEKG